MHAVMQDPLASNLTDIRNQLEFAKICVVGDVPTTPNASQGAARSGKSPRGKGEAGSGSKGGAGRQTSSPGAVSPRTVSPCVGDGLSEPGSEGRLGVERQLSGQASASTLDDGLMFDVEASQGTGPQATGQAGKGLFVSVCVWEGEEIQLYY